MNNVIKYFKLTILLVFCFVSLPEYAFANSKKEKRSSAVSKCSALLDSDAYGKKYRSYVFLVSGKDGWVFRSKKDFKQKFKFKDKNARLYRTFSNALKTQGTTLVLSVIPTRGIVAHEKLYFGDEITQAYDPKLAKDSYIAMIDRLNRHGVLTVGTPTPTIGAEFFNHADQHWSTEGAREMAQNIAKMIKPSSIWADMPEEKYKTIIKKEVGFEARYSEIVENLCGFNLPQEKYREAKTIHINNDGDKISDQVEENISSKVVLVGTSNSKRDEFGSNFSGFLKEFLSTDVYNAAISGGGMDDSILNYLDSKIFKDTPPSFLIWEVPVYYNIGGEGMENTLRQGIGRVYGYCDKPLVEFASKKVLDKDIYLMKNIDQNKIMVNSAYIAIKFNKTVRDDFSVSFKTNDKNNNEFKFQHRRNSNSNMFFYLPTGKERSYLKNIVLRSSDNIKGLMVTARLCPMPINN